MMSPEGSPGPIPPSPAAPGRGTDQPGPPLGSPDVTPPPEPLRLVVVGHRHQLRRHPRSVYAALGRTFDLTTVFVDDGWPRRARDVGALADADACMWFVRFRELADRPEGFDWRGFEGPRLMYEWDAHMHFNTMNTARYLGRWPDVFHRNGFELLVASGRQTAARLEADGVPSAWVAKAFDPEVFGDLGRPRSGLGYYGRTYHARRAMLDHLRWRRIPVERFSCPYDEVNSHLNRYLAILLCNLSGQLRPIVGRPLNVLAPSLAVRLGPAGEPMLKNFEVAGAGCAPVTDRLPELAELGFVDGETMVGYDDFDELTDRLRHLLADPERLAAIGRAAAVLAHDRHTWDHRARQLDGIIRDLR